MNSRDIFAVGARLLGIFLLAVAAASVAAVPVALESSRSSGGVANPGLLWLSPLLAALVYACIGAFLLIRYRVSDAPPSAGSPSMGLPTYSAALSLLGVYFVAVGVPELVQSLLEATAWGSLFALASSGIASAVLSIAIGVLLLARSQWLASRILPVSLPILRSEPIAKEAPGATDLSSDGGSTGS